MNALMIQLVSLLVFFIGINFFTSNEIVVDAQAMTQQLDRQFTEFQKCDGLPTSISFPMPCFTCIDLVPSLSNINSAVEAIKIFDDKQIAIKEGFALLNRTDLKDMRPKSIYVHCNGGRNLGSVYNIYYNQTKCEGKPLFDEVLNSTCADCSTCTGAPGKCPLDPQCDKRCCAPVVPCSGCDDNNTCNFDKDFCQNCPTCDQLAQASNPCASCSPNLCSTQQCSQCSQCKTGRRLDLLSSPYWISESDQYLRQQFDVLDDDNLFMRSLDSTNQFTPYSASTEQDIKGFLYYGKFYGGIGCLENKSINKMLLPVSNCTSISNDADGSTLAISVSCKLIDSGYIQSRVIGYGSIQDCLSEANPTFDVTTPEDQCINATSNKWSIKARCGGWGQPPEPISPPKQPETDEMGVVIRKQYPDRRCQYYPDRQVPGSIDPCNVCLSQPGPVYLKIDCKTMSRKIYSKSDCTGTFKTEEPIRCQGDVIRGAYNDEVETGPIKSYAFVVLHGGDLCVADNVAAYLGTKSNACSSFKLPDGRYQTIKVDCANKLFTTYKDQACAVQERSRSFVDNQCDPMNPNDSKAGKLRISCAGYINSAGSRTCTDFPRGCSGYSTNTCSNKFASWAVNGKSFSCNCVSTKSSYKVVFKLEIKNMNTSSFASEICNLKDIYNGAHAMIYEETRVATYSDFPVQIEGSALQSGTSIIITLGITGFLDSSLADSVVSFISSDYQQLENAIEDATSRESSFPFLDVAVVSGSATKVSNVEFCGCDNSNKSTGNSASSNMLSTKKLAQSIIAGMTLTNLIR